MSKDVRGKLEVIAHLGEHITYKEDMGIFYDSELAKVIEDAYIALKNGVTVQRWIPVTERLPEDDESLRFYDDGRLRFCTVLTYQKSHGVQISNRLRVVPFGNEYLDEQVTNGWKWSLGAKSVTHWMPLPTPPKDGE